MPPVETHVLHAYPPLLLKEPERLSSSGHSRWTYLVLFSCNVPPVAVSLLIEPLSKDIKVEMVKLSWEGVTLEETWHHYVQQSPAADWMPEAPTGALPVLLAAWPQRGIVPQANGLQYQCYLLLERSLPPLQLMVQACGEEVTATACWPRLSQTWQQVLEQQEGAHLNDLLEPGMNIYWLTLRGGFDAEEGCTFGQPAYATIVKPLSPDHLLVLDGATGNDPEIVPTYLCYRRDDAWCRGEPDLSWEQTADGTLARVVWQRKAYLKLYPGRDPGTVAEEGRSAYLSRVDAFMRQVALDWRNLPSDFVES